MQVKRLKIAKTLLIFITVFGIHTQSFSQNWQQLGSSINGEAAFDNSGRAVSLSADGSTLAIGAISNSGNGLSAGHVRVYKFISGDWVQQGEDIDGEAEGDNSGQSVSLNADGSILAIGANNNDGNGSDAGHVRVYKFISGDWVQQGEDIDGEDAINYSGWSVSLNANGDIVAIGATFNNGSAPASGHVRVYKFISGSWVQQGEDIDGEEAADFAGWSVSLNADGDIIAIGAPENDGGSSDAGHVRVFKFISGSWVQQGEDLDGQAIDEGFGQSVSLSSDGTTLAAGAINGAGNGPASGLVRVYKFTSGSWEQIGQDINGEAEYDRSGYAISLSADGSVLAIGAINNDGSASSAGHVRIYKYISGNWVQQGADIDGDAQDDSSGYSVSLSADGSIVAIGAPKNDASGTDAGHVRVFTSNVVGVLENDFAHQLNISPNPTTGNLVIELGEIKENVTINIFSLEGQLLYSNSYLHTQQIDLLVAQAKGMYLLEITADTKQVVFKLIKE